MLVQVVICYVVQFSKNNIIYELMIHGICLKYFFNLKNIYKKIIRCVHFHIQDLCKM